MRERRRGNRGVLRHVEVADVVQREGSGSCAGEARCGGVISESRRPCVGGGFVVSRSRCHVARVMVVCMCGCIRLCGQRCLRRTAMFGTCSYYSCPSSPCRPRLRSPGLIANQSQEAQTIGPGAPEAWSVAHSRDEMRRLPKLVRWNYCTCKT